MWTRQLLKQNGKIAFKRNYWTCVGASLIVGLLAGSGGASGASGDTSGELNFQISHIPDIVWFIISAVIIASILFAILVSSVVEVGGCRFYLENREHKTPVSQVFWGFREGRYGNNVWIIFMRNVYIFLWGLLLVIPGIIKGYSYKLVPYILAENPHISQERAFEISKQAMNGRKWDAFVLDWSFIGWEILSAFTFGILNVFYVSPYIHATQAEFYSAVKAEAIQKGITDTIELPGVIQRETVFEDQVVFEEDAVFTEEVVVEEEPVQDFTEDV